MNWLMVTVIGTLSILCSWTPIRAASWRHLLNRADSLSNSQNHDSAIAIGRLALEEASARVGPSDTATARVLDRLGMFEFYKVNLLPAETLLKEALAIREDALGHEHSDVARSLNNLATLYSEQGLYVKADPLCRRALAIQEKVLGPDHPDLCESLNLLANIYMFVANYVEAELVTRRALAILENALGPEHQDVATSLNVMAKIYFVQRRYAEAESFYQRALVIREKTLASEHSDLAMSLNNLSGIYKRQGKYAEAEPLLRRALTIQEKVQGPDHPDLAMGLLNLAGLYFNQGKYDDAEPLYLRALVIWENAYAPYHRLVGWALEKTAAFYRSTHRVEDALMTSKRAVEIFRRSFFDNVYALSERDALEYSLRYRSSAGIWFSCFADLSPHDSETVAAASDLTLSCKGLVTDIILRRRQALVSEKDSATLAIAEAWRSTRLRLGQLYAMGRIDDTNGEYEREMDSLSNAAGDLESRLARRSTSFRIRQDYQNAPSAQVASLLPDRSVLIEYLRYDDWQPKPDTTILHYLVAVVTPDSIKSVIDLGEAGPIDHLIALYRSHLEALAAKQSPPTQSDLDEYTPIAQALYARVMKPIEDHLLNRELVLIAPDGDLNLVSFGGLVAADGRYVAEKLALSYLTSGRDLIRLIDRPAQGSGLLALGDPDFDATLEVRQSLSQELILPKVDSNLSWSVRSGCGSPADLKVQRLPFTHHEVEQIAELWRDVQKESATVLLGVRATEDAFMAQASGKRAIHLATHGYYWVDKCESNVESRPVAGTRERFIDDNPSLLSGLLLAGSNLLGAGCDSVGLEDGILSAYEVAMMDLLGTDIVVLSACETGLGQVEMGEGMHGLRRAFHAAGVRTVVSALWPVSDKTTSDIMKGLYSGSDTPLYKRMWDVQLAWMENLQTYGLANHPFNWAAFVISGDWK